MLRLLHPVQDDKIQVSCEQIPIKKLIEEAAKKEKGNIQMHNAKTMFSNFHTTCYFLQEMALAISRLSITVNSEAFLWRSF